MEVIHLIMLLYEMDFWDNNDNNKINTNNLFSLLESASEVMEVELTYFLIYALIFLKSSLGDWGSVKNPMKGKFAL